MYMRDSHSWLKHWDFILFDLICLQAAFLLSILCAGYTFNPYLIPVYRDMAVFIELADFLVMVLFGTMQDVIKRGHYREFVATLQQGLLIGATSVLYLFLLQMGKEYSRLALMLMVVIYTVLSYVARELWKRFLVARTKREGHRSLLVVTTREQAPKVIAEIDDNNFLRFRIAGLVLMDGGGPGESIEGVNVVSTVQDAPEYVCQEWVDEVLVALPDSFDYPKKLIERIAETGVVIHYDLSERMALPGTKQFIESIGDRTVMTTSLNYASPFQIFIKRTMDIVLGALGCAVTGVVFIFIAPAIYMQSPGPVFYSQERVGKNGRKFKMYKFRSMHLDADERRDEFLEENRLADGRMFKLDFDPRVIGNTVLPDGGKKTGIGDFIRRTSLDEFPQFFNVLKGDMSVVGTRPPLTSETDRYELHHRARLAIKPGITGMWQVSGRSNITDFEEVVRLDREYIDNWSIGLDCKILLKTVLVVAKHEGSL